MIEVKGKLREFALDNGEVRREFYCPGCDKRHAVNQMWGFDGNYNAPTFSPSVLTQGSPWENRQCHIFVRAGRIEYLPDCTHALAGQTVDLPDWPL